MSTSGITPTQTLDTSHLGWDAEAEQRDLDLRRKESQWWALWPGEDGYGVPLWEYLGFTDEQEWRFYAISEQRCR